MSLKSFHLQTLEVKNYKMEDAYWKRTYLSLLTTASVNFNFWMQIVVIFAAQHQTVNLAHKSQQFTETVQ